MAARKAGCQVWPTKKPESVASTPPAKYWADNINHID